jgi:pullulanase
VKDRGYATGDISSAGFIPLEVVGAIDYGNGGARFTQNPDEAINFASTHDGYTLWDHLLNDPSATDDAIRIKMDELAQAIVFTSQGVPFIQGGEELLRTKSGNGNSYNAGDAVNELDWSRKQEHMDVFNYYAGLIHLRRDHPALRMDDPATVRGHLTFMDSPSNSIQYELTGNANGDSWKNIVVVYNPNSTAITATLPSGSWTIVANGGTVGSTPLGTASGSVSVPDYSMMVLHQ